MPQKKIPINRMSKFFDDEDFSLEIEMAREFVEGDLHISVILFQVDRIKSQTDDLYGETDANKIRFKPPKEIFVKLVLDEAKNETYAEGHLRHLDYGNLTFTVFVKHLEELGVDIDYGDYIGYADREDNIKYFTVTDDGKIFSDNRHTRLGYKGYYRTIKTVVADTEEFNPQY